MDGEKKYRGLVFRPRPGLDAPECIEVVREHAVDKNLRGGFLGTLQRRREGAHVPPGAVWYLDVDGLGEYNLPVTSEQQAILLVGQLVAFHDFLMI